MQGINVSAKTLGILAGFMKSAPGQKIGADGIISILNSSGSKPPLLWVFNSVQEIGNLAAGLGQDQPLIAMRSLNTVIPMQKVIAWDERILADHYANTLRGYLGSRGFFLGGNCQGAPIAGYLARALLLSGFSLQAFVAMEWTDLPPLPVQSTLLFGADSANHNPFLKHLDPRPVWECMYPKYRVDFLPGTHGTYFTPERLQNLVNSLNEVMGSKMRLTSPIRPAMQMTNLPKTCHVNQKLSVSAAVPGGVGEDKLMFVWDRHTTTLPHRELTRPDVRADGISVHMTAPEEPGLWTVQSYRCRAGEGAVAWLEETQLYHQIEVLDGL